MAGRAVGKAAASGRGRAEAFAALSAARHRRGERRTAEAAAEQARIEARIDRARATDSRTPDAGRRDLWR